MMRFTLAMAVLPLFTLGAQTPPPPAPPAPAPKAAPVTPLESPKAKAPKPASKWSDEERVYDLEQKLRDKAWRDQERMLYEQDKMREAQEKVREEMYFKRDLALNDKWMTPPLASPKALAPMTPPSPMTPSAWSSLVPNDLDGRFLNQRPREAWAQGDPADSLYKLGREALNRGEYRRAADLFSQISRRYPSSAYAPQSLYWEAFSRYRIGTTDDLRLASRALDALAQRSAQLSRETDVAGLRTRIDGALAVRGDPDASDRVRQKARSGDNDGEGGGACDKEDLTVRVEALSALAQMDPNAALPTLRRVLERRDECSKELRRRAVFMLARRGDGEATTLLAGVARNDPDLDVRAEAIQYLIKMPGDVGISTIEDILRTTDEERIQRVAISALMSSDNPRARQSTRAILERRDASERLRMEALGRFDRERSTAEDAAFLRAYYARVESERIKESVLSALSRIGGRENEDFLMAVARNQEEPPSMRAAAISRLSRSPSISIADLSRLYDVADTRSMREQVIGALANRKEDQATDKLIDIAKNSTDVNARRVAISALTRRNDPRAAAAIRELVEK